VPEPGSPHSAWAARYTPIAQGEKPAFRDAAVHDPSVLFAQRRYYIIGSHMAFAVTDDFMRWEQLAAAVAPGHILCADMRTEFAEALEWSRTDTFWAGDMMQLESTGAYYLYYCTCEGSMPLACLGRAVSDSPEGPFTDDGILLRSGVHGSTPEGGYYDAARMPNCIDPDVFYDEEGRLWLLYGSYSGGIFILELDTATGLPLDGSTYGKKLLGGNHAPIEGAYMQYSPQTGYYYLFVSYGGLAADGGYNIRVARSQTPDGEYLDSEGKAVSEITSSAVMDRYMTKLMGNFRWAKAEGDPGRAAGYVSPGHCSTWYDEESGRYLLIFHTRFTGQGELHQVRVHEMFLNEDGWFVVSPTRYVPDTYAGYDLNPADITAGSQQGEGFLTQTEIAGEYKFLCHGHTTTKAIVDSLFATLYEDGTLEVSDGRTGTWEVADTGDGRRGLACRMTLDGASYTGVFCRGYDETAQAYTVQWSVMSSGRHRLVGDACALFVIKNRPVGGLRLWVMFG